MATKYLAFLAFTVGNYDLFQVEIKVTQLVGCY